MKFNIKRLKPMEIELYGEKYPLILTFEALAELESLTGRTFSNIFMELVDEDKLSIKTLQTALYVMLKSGGVDLQLSDLADVPFAPDMIQIISEAIASAVPLDEEKDKKKMNP